MTTHALRTLRRTLALVALPALAASLVLAAPVAARTPVDPNTLNPAPPDFFNAECWDGAGGTVCTLHFSDDPIVDEPSGVLCGATELLFSQTRSVVGKRFYDADGNLLQRHFREALDGAVTNPDTGDSVPVDPARHRAAQPRDPRRRRLRASTKITGLYSRFYLPGGGTIQMDAGTFTATTSPARSSARAGRIRSTTTSSTATRRRSSRCARRSGWADRHAILEAGPGLRVRPSRATPFLRA